MFELFKTKEKLKDQKISDFEEDILFIHPVDYLYEEFKKLNN